MTADFLWMMLWAIGLGALVYLHVLTRTLPRDRLIADLSARLAAYEHRDAEEARQPLFALARAQNAGFRREAA